VLVAQTVAGLQGSSSGAVTASTLKRTLLRKDPTFTESDYGFRTFGELLRHLEERNVVELAEGPAKGDPEVSLPEHGDREEAFSLLAIRGPRRGWQPRRGSTFRTEEPGSQSTARTSARRSSATAASCNSARRRHHRAVDLQWSPEPTTTCSPPHRDHAIHSQRRRRPVNP